MNKAKGLEVSLAIAEAVKQADVDVVAAYPITPQTHIVEELSVYVANGELDAEYVPVESEHSAMSAAVGSSAAGARTYTATSAQGLALMHEILFIASGLRLPIVMTVANRALSAPISIWNDHGDIMSERDIGWIQIFAENGQEAYELTIAAFKIAEDHRVLLPICVNVDGFILTHMIEPINFIDQNEVDKFLPPFKPALTLDPEKPVTMGPVGVPEVYIESRKQCEQALINSKAVVSEVLADWGQRFNQKYRLIERNGAASPKTVFITMGSMGETTMTAVKELEESGQSLGQVRIRLWRPFPKEEFLDAIKDVEEIIVIDRALSPGSHSGPVAQEIKALLYDQPQKPKIHNIIAGLGGRDVTVKDFKKMYEMARNNELDPNYTIWGVRSDA
ncbi:pyruvate ferredoxin oxidoreductase [Desulfonatronovibrio hydrogenovorans]|uniref:pyruvate ferredoxin oxidoreductase n=1 Tax=Desulfonatronovibrio hydrogenovorans TaxID=53245 RepID=UPI00048ECC26|nr:pyruvate ferredoxin oxidoreductase [Desulfonatronovibrio hydrogenovorans]